MLSTQIQQLILIAKSKGEISQKTINVILARARQLGDNQDEVLKELGIAETQQNDVTLQQPRSLPQQQGPLPQQPRPADQNMPAVDRKSVDEMFGHDDNFSSSNEDTDTGNSSLSGFFNKKTLIIAGAVIGVLCLMQLASVALSKWSSDKTPQWSTEVTTTDNNMSNEYSEDADDEDVLPQDMTLRELHDEYISGETPIGSGHCFGLVEQWSSALCEQRLTESDIEGIDSEFLRILRNSIFARHNYRFKSDDLMDFFSFYDWYTPSKADVTHELSDIENYNIQLIKSHE